MISNRPSWSSRANKKCIHTLPLLPSCLNPRAKIKDKRFENAGSTYVAAI
jgi:hypothetical protein